MTLNTSTFDSCSSCAPHSASPMAMLRTATMRSVRAILHKAVQIRCKIMVLL